jgi:hypothetical protein
MNKLEAVQKMIQMLQMECPPLFVVMLRPGSGYEIEGHQHEELHLTVSTHHTPFIHQTEDGFECIALFPSDTTSNNGIWDPELAHQTVQTRLNVRLRNIARIDGVSEDGQEKLMTLYEEPLVMDERERYLAVFARTASLLWL